MNIFAKNLNQVKLLFIILLGINTSVISSKLALVEPVTVLNCKNKAEDVTSEININWYAKAGICTSLAVAAGYKTYLKRDDIKSGFQNFKLSFKDFWSKSEKSNVLSKKDLSSLETVLKDWTPEDLENLKNSKQSLAKLEANFIAKNKYSSLWGKLNNLGIFGTAIGSVFAHTITGNTNLMSTLSGSLNTFVFDPASYVLSPVNKLVGFLGARDLGYFVGKSGLENKLINFKTYLNTTGLKISLSSNSVENSKIYLDNKLETNLDLTQVAIRNIQEIRDASLILLGFIEYKQEKLAYDKHSDLKIIDAKVQAVNGIKKKLLEAVNSFIYNSCQALEDANLVRENAQVTKISLAIDTLYQEVGLAVNSFGSVLEDN